MAKTNWLRVFLGGLVTGIVVIVLEFATYAMYLKKLYDPAMEALGHPMLASSGMYVLAIVYSLLSGILAVWLYSAIRPRYGAGAKTAVVAGFAVWIMYVLFFALNMALLGLFPDKLLVIDALTNLVIVVLATLAGAWIYREPA